MKDNFSMGHEKHKALLKLLISSFCLKYRKFQLATQRPDKFQWLYIMFPKLGHNQGLLGRYIQLADRTYRKLQKANTVSYTKTCDERALTDQGENQETLD